MKVGARIGLAVGAMAAAALAFAVSCFIAIHHLGGQAIALYDGPMMAISFARSAHSNALVAGHQADALESASGVLDIDALELALDDLITDLEVVAERSQSTQTLQLVDDILPIAQSALEAVIALIEEDEPLPANYAETLRGFADQISTMVDSEAEYGYLVRERVIASERNTLVWAGTFIAVALSVSGTMAWVIATRIAHRLGRINSTMREIANGDLDAEVPFVTDRDEIGGVARAAGEFRQALIRQKELEEQASLERQFAEDAKLAAEARSKEVVAARAEAEAVHERHAKKSAVADAFFIAFSRVVKRAMHGHFDERVGARFDDDDYDGLSRAANKMLEAIESSILETSKVIGDLAAGRLETVMSGEYLGSFATLQRDINATAEKLREVVREISGSSGLIIAEVSDLSESAQQLSKRSTSQASALEETNAAISQITETIADNVSGAKEAAAGVRRAAEEAKNGQQIVSDAVDAMTEIETNSQHVSQIVDVIEQISFQTNLLALNAGVEASRAGDAGRGFGVVAQEVRQLALRASAAARDISELIDQSNSSVGKGATLVRDAGEMLNRIVDTVSEVEATTDSM